MKSPRSVEILCICRAPEYPRSRVYNGVPLGPWERFPSFQQSNSRHLRFDSWCLVQIHICEREDAFDWRLSVKNFKSKTIFALCVFFYDSVLSCMNNLEEKKRIKVRDVGSHLIPRALWWAKKNNIWLKKLTKSPISVLGFAELVLRMLKGQNIYIRD